MLFLREIRPIVVADPEFDGEALNAYDLEELKEVAQYMLGRAFHGVQDLEKKTEVLLQALLPAQRLDNPAEFSRCEPYPSGEYAVCEFVARAREDVHSRLVLFIERRKCAYHFHRCVQACQRLVGLTEEEVRTQERGVWSTIDFWHRDLPGDGGEADG